jgi:hypothetical protein
VRGTLSHEAAHGPAQTRGVADTSRQGRYHSRRYRQLAVELGLDVVETPPIGWSGTAVGETTQQDYCDELEQLVPR